MQLSDEKSTLYEKNYFIAEPASKFFFNSSPDP
jgi:hypothetical protein